MARSYGALGMDPLDQGFSSMSLGGDQLAPIKYAPKKYGSRGNPVDLLVNFFKIDLNPQTPNYFHYNIEILKDDGSISVSSDAPAAKGKGGRKRAAQQQQQQEQQQPQKKKDDTPKSKKMPKKLHDQIFAEMLTRYKSIFNCPFPPVFDGEKNFYSITKFAIPNNSWSGKVTIKDIEKEESFIVNVTVPEISHGQNLKRLNEKDGQVMPIELQALDIIMRNGPRLCKISLGSNFFAKSADASWKSYKFDIGNDLLKYGQFGHYQCAKKTEKGLVYNVDRAMAVFTYGDHILDVVKDLNRGNDKQLGPREKGQLEELVKGLKFRALHLNYTRSFIISGLSKDTIRNTMFTLDSEAGAKQKISVFDYFRTTYATFCQRNPLNPNLPAVQVGGSRNAKYFPMEVCRLLSDEVYRRKLNPVLQGMVTRTSSQQTPFARFRGIESHIQTIEKDNTIKVNGKEVNYLREYGIKISPKAMQVQARILQPPPVEYAGGVQVESRGTGQWDMRNAKFFQPSNIGSDWGVVNFHTLFGRENRSSIYKNKVDGLVQSLISDARNKGINMSNPKEVVYNYDYRGKNTMEQQLFAPLVRKGLKLVIILIPTRDEIYNEIKSVSELKLGLITQCLNQDQKYWRDDRLSGQLITNFFLKINPKCSGTNQTINTSHRPPLLKGRTMIIGLDVTHPSPTDGLSKSIAACVASFTKDFDRCFQRIVVQEKARKEVVNLKDIVIDLLQNFSQANKGSFPTKILVYRDGIGEGDFEKIIQVELEAIKQACTQLGQQIKVTYVMVQKRHNTRFLPVRAQERDKASFQNIKPGTVVDREIVHHSLFEFYLCSHAGMMGTSRPSKYVVLRDENDLSADELQASTYFLCYLYPRCTKSSSIPPFVAYAHLMAKRARAYLAHLEERDGQSSSSSGQQKMDVLAKAQIDEFNRKITVQANINGIMFFI